MKPLVLMIEDDRRFATIHKNVLTTRGFDVSHAVNGDEGVKRAADELPAVILLDIGLPKKDGFQVLQELKADPQTANIPVIMLSRLGTREDIDQAFSLGAAEYMIKTQHSPEDVADHVLRRVGAKPGFTIPELLLVIGGILVLLGLVYWQVTHPKPAAPPTPAPGEVILEPTP